MCTSHLAQHRVFVVWVLIVLFSGVDIEHVDSNADTAWELVFQILCRSEVLELKKVVSGKLGEKVHWQQRYQLSKFRDSC